MFINVMVVVRLAYEQSTKSAFIVAREDDLFWPVLLVKTADWTNLKVAKAVLHKELASSLSLIDFSTNFPLVKLYYWDLVHSSSEPSLHFTNTKPHGR